MNNSKTFFKRSMLCCGYAIHTNFISEYLSNIRNELASESFSASTTTERKTEQNRTKMNRTEQNRTETQTEGDKRERERTKIDKEKLFHICQLESCQFSSSFIRNAMALISILLIDGSIFAFVFHFTFTLLPNPIGWQFPMNGNFRDTNKRIHSNLGEASSEHTKKNY